MTDQSNLERDNTILRARCEWNTNLLQKLCVMIKNAADVFEVSAANVEQLALELRRTHGIYSKLHQDITEAIHERAQSNPGS